MHEYTETESKYTGKIGKHKHVGTNYAERSKAKKF